MMVPRAFHYATPPPLRSPTQNEKEGVVDTSRPKREGRDRTSSSKMTKPLMMSTVPPATPSKPVVIPTRTRSPRLQKRRSTVAKVPPEQEIRNSPHQEDVLSPSMIALLSITSVPGPKGLAAHRMNSGRSRKLSDLKSLEGSRAYDLRRSLSSSSPQSWELLQSPPSESDISDGLSVSSDNTIAPFSSYRSLSSDSMPSLDLDLESPKSVSQTSTPGNRSGRRDRRVKSVSQSLVEKCGLDHPLSPSRNEKLPEMTDSPTPSNVDIVSPDISMPVSPSRFSFKSNLTASIRVLKSAAQSFSNMAVQRDEFLTRSILSITPQFTDERRPAPSEDIPDPALRRYLNPIAASPSELHFHRNHGSHRVAPERCTTSIQLQTYQRIATTSKNATSPPIFIPSSRDGLKNEPLVEAYSSARQREPRENSDFLRVIVLEMNMRKAGKLNEAAMGRARIWLPPRQLVEPRDRERHSVPRRWSGIVE
ncbi:hypothetical protein MMC19_005325 [Ptychographa xylographoides]|nr:hypothetical protein [Ptychographa xylographoides]